MRLKFDGSRLARIRAEKGWRHEDAAKRAGVSLPTYKNAEYGKPVQVVPAGKIAKAFRIPIDDLEEAKSA